MILYLAQLCVKVWLIMSVAGRVIVYGGRGALGSTVVSVFKKNQFWVCNIDMQVYFSPVLNEDNLYELFFKRNHGNLWGYYVKGQGFIKQSHDP